MNIRKILIFWILILSINPIFSQTGSDFEFFTLREHKSPIKDIVFNNNQSMMATISDSTIILWKLSKSGNSEPVSVKKIVEKGIVNSVCFFDDDKTLITVGETQSVNFWDVESAVKKKTFKIRYTQEEVDAIKNTSEKREIDKRQWESRNSNSSRGNTKEKTNSKFEKDEVGDFPSVIYKVIADKGDIYTAHADNTIKIWDAKSDYGKMQTFMASPSEMHAWDVNDICFSNDMRSIFSASDDNYIKKWSVSSIRLENTFKGHSRSVTRVVLSPNGKYLASIAKDNSVRIWSLDGKEICGALAERDKNIYGVAFSPDGKFLAIAEESGVMLSIVNNNGKLTPIGKTVVFDFEKITTIAFSPVTNTGNIQLLVANEAGEIKSIDVRVLIVRKHFEKQYAEQKKKSGLFLPQDEFEKTEDYEKRVATGDIFLEKLDREYMLKFSEISLDFEDNTVKSNEKKITLKIKNIGTYNPDNEKFAITIENTEREIEIPLSDAPNFKKNQSKIVVTALQVTTDGKTKITNVKITDPNTKKVYDFGDLDTKEN